MGGDLGGVHGEDGVLELEEGEREDERGGAEEHGGGGGAAAAEEEGAVPAEVRPPRRSLLVGDDDGGGVGVGLGFLCHCCGRVLDRCLLNCLYGGEVCVCLYHYDIICTSLTEFVRFIYLCLFIYLSLRIAWFVD